MRPNSRKWTDAEVEWLKAHAPEMTLEELSSRLDRSPSSIENKLSILRLRGCAVSFKKLDRTTWTPEHVKTLLREVTKTEIAKIAKKIGKTPNAVVRKVTYLRQEGNNIPHKNRKRHAAQYPPTLCWKCSRAVGPRMCSWAAFAIPVKGWTAEPTVILAQEERTESYCVYECPSFEPDARRERGYVG